MNQEPAFGDSLDLAPAKWIWIPSQRTLANTFVLFRKEITLQDQPLSATGWILADSRYLLRVNGQRVQWGPAPSDPRWPEADPVDLGAYLKPGTNVIAVEVLYYGHGEGTWVTGKPGLLFRLELQNAAGTKETLCTDRSWQCRLDRAHRPGQYKRWYLRALQETFDARLHPHGWDLPGHRMDDAWQPALQISDAADQPSICSDYPDYLTDCGVDESSQPGLRKRQIGGMVETATAPVRKATQGKIEWTRDPDDWFEMRMPQSFAIREVTRVQQAYQGEKETLPLQGDRLGSFVIYEFAEQMTGWPFLEVDAPEGTVVELIFQEAHDPQSTPWLDRHRFTWSRFICQEGKNDLQTFDYESLRWLQVHVRGDSGKAVIQNVGVLRRQYDWPHRPSIELPEPGLQRLMQACVNTIVNNAQETIVDGMGRERQQYSGDIGHELHAIRYAFGETRLAERYLDTFSAGITPEGYFIDCWPAYDRMVRIPQRLMGLTPWGPILDHGIQFVFDCWNHHWETGRTQTVARILPRLLRFARYLRELRGQDGLLPVSGLGVPIVWMDTDAYQAQRHKQCAFNLHAAAMYRHALAPLCRALGQEGEGEWETLGRQLHEATVAAFWDPKRELFVNNLPWLAEEKTPAYCDRSLAMAVLFDLCPGGKAKASLDLLQHGDAALGLSFPPNGGWRLRALAYGGRGDAALQLLRQCWAKLDSVLQNNTLAEVWQPDADGSTQWSHAAVAPLYVLCMDLAGIQPLSPGFAAMKIRPQLHDLEQLKLTVHTARGPLSFESKQKDGVQTLKIALPCCEKAVLQLEEGQTCDLHAKGAPDASGLCHYPLEPGRENIVRVWDA